MEDGMVQMLIVFAFGLLFDVGLIVFFWKRYQRYKALESMDGLDAKAIITKLSRHTGKHNSVTYRAHYDFKDYKGQSFSGRHTISQSLYDSLQQGDTITITYLRQNPKVNANRESLPNLLRFYRFLALIMVGSLHIFIVAAVVVYLSLQTNLGA